MRRLMAVAAAVTLAATACAGGEAPRTILVDYSHDEFASFIAANFPREVTVHPGTELVFKQTWTGEPHSVTGGTMANELMELVEPFILGALRGEEVPDDPPQEVKELRSKHPFAYYEDEDATDYNQSAAQPCYLDEGTPPTDGRPCDDRFQEQPAAFTGRQTYYNSGLIPYEGPRGNEYRVQLSGDISPGEYWFYCNVHGEFQSTKVVVKPSTEQVDSTASVNRRAREEIRKALDPVLTVFKRAQEGELQLDPKDTDSVVEGNFAGLFDPGSSSWHSINEFVPRRMKVKAGEKVTWNLFGFHTISFGVPEYFPILTFEEDGTVKRNPKLDPPAGGAKTQEIPDFDPERHEPIAYDGGTYDGTGFWSSGAIAGDPWIEYSMKISEPGTYRYACLVHPPMVGTLEVT